MQHAQDFLQNFHFSLSSDLCRDGSVPMPWADGQPQQWGLEQHAVDLRARPLCVTASQDERLCAVGAVGSILIYSLKKIELVSEIAYKAKFYQIYIRSLSVHITDATDAEYLLFACARTLGSEKTWLYMTWKIRSNGRPVSTEPSMLDLPSTATYVQMSPALIPNTPVLLSYCDNDGAEVDQPLKVRYEQRRHNPQPTKIISYDPLAQSRIGVISRHEDKIVWKGTSPDNRAIAAIDRIGVLKICKAEPAKEVLCVEGESDGGMRDCACFSPDSKFLAVHQRNDHIYVYDTNSGLKLRSFQTKPVLQENSTQNGKLTCMEWSAEGRYLAGIGGDSTVRVWVWNPFHSSSETEEMIWRLDTSGPDKCWIRQIALQWVPISDGSSLRSILAWKGSEGGINVYDLEGGKKWRFEAKKSDLERMVRVNDGASLLLLPQSNVAISADVDEVLRVWRIYL